MRHEPRDRPVALTAAALVLCCAAPVLASAAAAAGIVVWVIGGGLLAALAATITGLVLVPAHRGGVAEPHDCLQR
jgi:hypothetical protein